MVKVGDRIRLSSTKGPDRDGVVTAVTGSLLRVRWPSEEETTVVPAPGTITVLAAPDTVKETARTKKAAGKKSATATKATSGKKAPADNARSRSKAAKRPSRSMCPATRELVSAGRSMEPVSLYRSVLAGNSVRCPHRGITHIWSKAEAIID